MTLPEESESLCGSSSASTSGAAGSGASSCLAVIKGEMHINQNCHAGGGGAGHVVQPGYLEVIGALSLCFSVK